MVRLVLEAGGDKRCLNRKRRNPVDVARQYGRKRNAEIIEDWIPFHLEATMGVTGSEEEDSSDETEERTGTWGRARVGEQQEDDFISGHAKYSATFEDSLTQSSHANIKLKNLERRRRLAAIGDSKVEGVVADSVPSASYHENSEGSWSIGSSPTPSFRRCSEEGNTDLSLSSRDQDDTHTYSLPSQQTQEHKDRVTTLSSEEDLPMEKLVKENDANTEEDCTGSNAIAKFLAREQRFRKRVTAVAERWPETHAPFALASENRPMAFSLSPSGIHRRDNRDRGRRVREKHDSAKGHRGGRSMTRRQQRMNEVGNIPEKTSSYAHAFGMALAVRVRARRRRLRPLPLSLRRGDLRRAFPVYVDDKRFVNHEVCGCASE